MDFPIVIGKYDIPFVTNNQTSNVHVYTLHLEENLGYKCRMALLFTKYLQFYLHSDMQLFQLRKWPITLNFFTVFLI